MRLREPFNAGSHLVGFLLAGLGTWYLIREANGRAQLLAFGIYGATLLLLYGASTCYHGLHLSATGLRRLRTLDHIAIYFLIAGIAYLGLGIFSKGISGGARTLDIILGLLFIVGGIIVLANPSESAVFFGIFLGILVGILWIIAPNYYGEVWDEWYIKPALGAAFVWMMIGNYVMSRMVKFSV